MAPADQPAQLLRIARGQPDETQTAAVTAVVLALLSGAGHGPAPVPARARHPWSDPSRLVRPAISPGPGAWRASALPR